MTLVTRAALASTAAIRWEIQYRDSPPDSPQQRTLEALRALGPTPHPDEVDRIIGNDSWTTEPCSECGNRRPSRVVVIGEVSDPDSRAALCPECARKAAALVEEADG